MEPNIPVTQIGAYPRDDNAVAITNGGLQTTTSKTFSANGATANIPIFSVIGTVQVTGIFAVVTTLLGNHTAASWRINDQTAQVQITSVGGTTLTGIAVGSTIVKKGLAAVALTKLDNAAGVVSEPTTLETLYFSPFVVMQKTGAATNIEYNYTTSDTPTTGAMQFFIQWLPVSSGSTIQPL